MIHSVPEYPPKDQFVLLWDGINKKWMIACYSELNGKGYWVTDKRMYFPLCDQFQKWTELPEAVS